MATYISLHLQGGDVQRLNDLYLSTGFWDLVAGSPFSKSEWLQATRLAPTIKDDFYTVLSSRDCLKEVEHLLRHDEQLRRCVV